MGARTFWDSLRYAAAGLAHSLSIGRNMRLHCLAAALVLSFAWQLRFSRIELAILALTIGAVLAAEMFNTAIELTVDLITKEYDPLAKLAKNVAAGAVLITALVAVVIGGMLFLSKIVGFS